MTDEIDLLKAVITSPDDDVLRVAYADWLQEHDAPVQAARDCTMCHKGRQNDCEPGDITCNEWGCEHCGGTGTITATKPGGRHARAALIRAGCELAAVKPIRARTKPIISYMADVPSAHVFLGYDWPPERPALEQREWDVWIYGGGLSAVADAVQGARPPECCPQLLRHKYVGAHIPPRSETYVDRGFVCELAWPAADFLKYADNILWHPDQTVKCPDCYKGVLNEGGRGELCRTCDGDGEIPRPCPPTAQPIRAVTLTGLAAPIHTFHDDGNASIVGRTCRYWVPRGEPHDHSFRGIAKTLLEAEFPGVVFTVDAT